MTSTTKQTPRRWREVTMDELRTIWSDLQARGVWYNGCTSIELGNIYGPENVKHKMGTGWFKLTAKGIAS